MQVTKSVGGGGRYCSRYCSMYLTLLQCWDGDKVEGRRSKLEGEVKMRRKMKSESETEEGDGQKTTYSNVCLCFLASANALEMQRGLPF